MSADVFHLCDYEPKKPLSTSEQAERRALVQALYNVERRMISAISDCMRLDIMVDECRSENKPRLAHSVQQEYDEEVQNAANAMRAVMLMRMKLGLPPHALCVAYEMARGTEQ